MRDNFAQSSKTKGETKRFYNFEYVDFVIGDFKTRHFKINVSKHLQNLNSTLFLSSLFWPILPTYRRAGVAQSVYRLATGWTVRGSNPGGGKTFRTCPDRPWGPTSLLYNWYRVFPGGKVRPGRDADPSPPSSAVVKKGQSYTSTLPIGRTACTEPQCLYKGALYFTLLDCR